MAMKRVMALVLSISIIILVQSVVVVNAITDIDDKCIRQVYEIGYDLDETNENVMNALTQLETDSGMMSQEAK